MYCYIIKITKEINRIITELVKVNVFQLNVSSISIYIFQFKLFKITVDLHQILRNNSQKLLCIFYLVARYEN